MKRMKKLTLAALASAIALSLAACQGSGTNTETAAPDKTETASGETGKTADTQGAGGKTKISITFRDGGSDTLKNWFENAYETYDKKDSIELDIAPITASEGDYFAKVALALQSADTAPDIVCEDTFQLPSDVAAGYLTDLSSYLKDYKEWSDGTFYGPLVDGVTYADGSVYGVPYCTDTRGLWYNKEVFQAAGLDTQWQPKTWQEVLDTCKIIKEKCPDVVPFWCNSGVATGEATSMQTYEMLLYGTGEQLLDENDKWIVSSENILKSLNFISTIYKERYGPSLSKVLNGEAGNIASREYLPGGKLAISLDGYWMTGNYKDTGAAPWPEYEEKLGIAAMPTSEGQEPGSVTMSGGWALSIPQLSDQKDAAMDFIKHCMSYDVYLDTIIAQGNIATRTDIAKDSTYASQPFMEKCTGFLSGAFYRPRNSQYSTVTTHIQTMVESVVSGNSPEDAMAQYKSDVTNSVGAENTVEK
ncbi:extracellular solute-binding protein [Lacrimispora indolis]|uniref:extracellular solute-binding protein n=1 Tax=Lacrimispora indolis TaxID=69825 RepID=UPI0004626F5F|nr:extracellular solute-binding protein [[Clostridium] methoxybenzovorans]